MNKWTRWEDWVAVGVGLVAAVSALVLPAMGASMAWMLILGVLPIASGIVNLAMPGMAACGFGRVVNITSINGLRGKFGQANYAAAKAGLIGLTKTAAREFGKRGVTVNAVAPGMVMTDMARALPREVLDRAGSEAVLTRLAEPRDRASERRKRRFSLAVRPAPRYTQGVMLDVSVANATALQADRPAPPPRTVAIQDGIDTVPGR